MRVGAAIAMVVIGVAAAAAAPAVPSGSVTGTVVNLTGGRRPVAGQLVTLTAYVNGAQVEGFQTTTDSAGRFTFTVPAAPERTYVVNVKYQGGDYDSEPVTFRAGETRRQVTLRVYDPTTDPAVLRVSVHHIIVEAAAGAVQVAELLVVTNTTDRTFIGTTQRPDGKRETLRLSLPAGATQVQFLEGLMDCCASVTDGILVDTMDVKPGMRQIGYGYLVPAPTGTARLVRTLEYPTDRVEVFGTAAARFEVDPLTAQPSVQTDQGTYVHFSGGQMTPGARISIGVAGLPRPAPATRRLALAAFVGILAAGLAYPLLRRRSPERETPRELRLSRDELIMLVADLDDRFEVGEVPPDEYRRRRARLMAELARLSSAVPPTGTPAPQTDRREEEQR
ncbi:MAG: carboxypeptidase-like regulatory domain-containing protein [Armatimonadota bacterium]|nr:carboxypeptidase-like regulatory domain-containing protein [Armatimonadota bacterium]MDR7403372.1 carboxypeptidase-like regulatory domain-containing protein [Armatimonadota bacterium]